MIKDPIVAAAVAQKLQEAFRQLDESAFDVRHGGTDDEVQRYLEAVGPICADVIFRLMEPLYQAHPELAPENWHIDPDKLLSDFGEQS